MNAAYLPMFNAIMNGLSTILLLTGFVFIKRGVVDRHKKCMVGALIASAMFLTSYLIYHYRVGSVPYPHHDWTRPVYFAVLIPHIILAAVNVPFIILLVRRAFRGEFNRHRRLARWVWPSWMFVSVTGVIIYLMLYHM